MFTDLSKLPDKEKLLEALDLDEKCFDIISALVLGRKEEYTLSELDKLLTKFDIPMTSNPLLEHLSHLEKKNIVSSRYESKYRYIKLELEEFGNILFNDFIIPFVKDYEEAVQEASIISLDEIYNKLEYYYCNKGFTRLYFRLTYLLNPLGEKESLLLDYIDQLYQVTIDIYLHELTNRGPKDISYVLGKLGKIMN